MKRFKNPFYKFTDDNKIKTNSTAIETNDPIIDFIHLSVSDENINFVT